MISNLVDNINSVLWSNGVCYLIIAIGVYFTIATRGVQVRYLKESVKLLFGSKSSDQGLSSFQTFAMALASRVGTGTIAGVATAIASGGPGSIFWMWIISLVGAAPAYIEASLAQVYKEEVDGEYRGGPAFYILKGLGIKWYATLFSIVTIIAAGFLMTANQSFNISNSLYNAFSIPPIISGGVVCILIAIIIFGGTKRIGAVAGAIMPLLAGLYIVVAIIIIIVNIQKLPYVIGLIFSSAFAMNSVFGAILGSAISWGVKRGILTSEAGQGTGAITSGSAEVSHPTKQGLIQSFSVYTTLFVCTATAFMILMTDSYNVIVDGNVLVEYRPEITVVGASYTQAAVDTLISGFGSAFVAIALFFFAFTTIMAYYYQAESNLMYQLKDPKNRKKVSIIFRIIFVIAIFYSSISEADLVWALADVGIGAMLWTNLIAIVLLRKVAIAVFKDYEEQKRRGVDPVFEPDKIGIKNTDIWNKISKKYLNKQ